MKNKKILIIILMIISIINVICLIWGYLDGENETYSSFEDIPTKINNIPISAMLVFLIQILNIGLLIVILKKNKYTKLIIVSAIILILTVFIPVKYENSYTFSYLYRLFNGWF